MNPEHKKILKEIKNNQGEGTAHTSNDSYILSGHSYYDVSVPVRRQVAKDWLKQNKDIPQKDFVKVLDSLYKGESHEDKTLASYLLGYSKKPLDPIKPSGSWLVGRAFYAINECCALYCCLLPPKAGGGVRSCRWPGC